ncbi:DUF4340 domain-containing protein, partial [Planctomycetaceae bacterium AH-315-I19]|nr:DUF4340 domain-containing protein [Planctomycetaceae bacterium AH-315-I19]
ETWPAVLSAPVLGALGDFSALKSINTAPDRALPVDASSISTLRVDGSVSTVRFSREALGGKLLASVSAKNNAGEETGNPEIIHLVNSHDILPLAEPGPAAWRVANALPGVRNAARIRLQTKDQTIQLAKLNGLWTVRSPVSARANDEAIESLLGTLALLDIARFIDRDQPDRSTTGLENPRLTITLEQDVRSIDDQDRTRSHVRTTALLLGSASDVSGRYLYASPSKTSALLMELPSDRVAQISTAPRNYLALNASHIPKEDIGLITLRTGYDSVSERGFRKQRGQWRELMPDGSTEQIDDSLIDELLAFLTDQPGEPEPASTDEIISAGRVTLHDSSGKSLQSLDFSYTADGTMFARTGSVDILYYDFTAPSLLKLPPFSNRSLEAPIAAPVTMPQGATPSK